MTSESLMRRFILVGLFAGVLVLVPGVRPAAATGSLVMKMAVDAYRKGLVLLRHKNHKQALVLFSTAHRLVPKTAKTARTRLALRYLISLCRYKVGQLEASEDGFKAYLAKGRRPQWVFQAREALTQIRTARAKRAKAKAGPPKKAPRRVVAKQGQGARKGTAQTPAATKKPAAAAGKGGARMARAPAKPKAGASTPKGKGTKAADIKAKGAKPAAAKAKGRKVAVSSSKAGLPPPPGRAGRRPSRLPWYILGGGGAALVVGGLFMALGQSAKADRDSLKAEVDQNGSSLEQTRKILSLHEDAQARFTVGWIGIGVGAAAVGTAGVIALLKMKRGSSGSEVGEPPKRLQVSASPGALRVVWRF